MASSRGRWSIGCGAIGSWAFTSSVICATAAASKISTASARSTRPRKSSSRIRSIVSSPLMLLIAIAIWLEDRGPIFYRQVRMGLDGKPFDIVKFRSMKVGAESDTGAKWAEPGDPRRTRVGRLIRAWSLDELPQLFNVVRGDMSVVGPRPERPQFVEQFRAEFPQYMLRHKVRAGMTGWAQVHGWRGNTSIRMRIEHDLYYIENWSLMLDMKILFMTVIHGLRHENAY